MEYSGGETSTLCRPDLGFAMYLVHQVLPPARGVPGWSPIQVLTPLCVSYAVFHDPVGQSSERIHNQKKKRDDGISSGRGGRKGFAQCQGTQSSALGRRKNREVFQEPVCDGGKQEMCEGVTVIINTKYNETGCMT